MAVASHFGAAQPVAPKQAHGIRHIIRAHPIVAFFVLALGFSWGWQIPIFALTHQSLIGPWVILGPTLAGFVMAGITEGRSGMLKLLRRLLIWRVAVRWYVVALFALPLTWLVAVFLTPGGSGAFRLPAWSLALTYLGSFGYSFMAAIAVEEFGWRGFALPRMQKLLGPLVGTLVLGLLWGLWHLPGWAFFPSLTDAGSTLPSFVASFSLFVAMIASSAVLYTWLFNHTHGSVLIAGLLHASTNAAGGTFMVMFPAMFPHARIPVAYVIGVAIVAGAIVLATRGRLAMESYEPASESSAAGIAQGAAGQQADAASLGVGDLAERKVRWQRQ